MWNYYCYCCNQQIQNKKKKTSRIEYISESIGGAEERLKHGIYGKQIIKLQNMKIDASCWIRQDGRFKIVKEWNPTKLWYFSALHWTCCHDINWRRQQQLQKKTINTIVLYTFGGLFTIFVLFCFVFTLLCFAGCLTVPRDIINIVRIDQYTHVIIIIIYLLDFITNFGLLIFLHFGFEDLRCTVSYFVPCHAMPCNSAVFCHFICRICTVCTYNFYVWFIIVVLLVDIVFMAIVAYGYAMVNWV